MYNVPFSLLFVPSFFGVRRYMIVCMGKCYVSILRERKALVRMQITLFTLKKLALVYSKV
jgi:hypothetical protein